ncbi:MAG: type IV pilus secretin PilQ [Pseudomonadota bacterium]
MNTKPEGRAILVHLMAIGMLGLTSAVGLPSIAMAQAQAEASQTNSIDAINFSSSPDGKVVVNIVFKDALTNPPAGFAVENPPRIALDLPNTTNNLGKTAVDVGEGELRTMSVVQSGTRTRLVMNLSKSVAYDTKVDGKTLQVTLQGSRVVASQGGIISRFAEAKPSSQAHGLRDIDFRRGNNGEGRIVFDMSDNSTGIDIRRQGQRLIVDFVNTTLPRNLQRRLDVADFGTPVKLVDATTQGNNTHIVIEPQGVWEHSAYQTDNRFIVEVKPVREDPNKLVQGTQPGYSGEKLSLNFQNVEIRSVLQVIADFTGLNIITSDTVQGSLTLRLKDVPWDQALDIILKSKSLDKRKNGNVVLIAPKDELASREKLELEAKQQINDLEPLITETFRLKYQKAENLKKIFDTNSGGGESGGRRILSKRGSAVLDPRTNTLFVQDTPERLDEIRRLVGEIDIPTRQVLIEARIVIADDKFSRQLGVRFGAQGGARVGNLTSGYASTLSDSVAHAGVPVTGSPLANALNNNVNLPVTGAAGTIALTLFRTATNDLINVELSALETDNRGKVVSSPRVITSDQQEAIIEQGTQIPYLQASSSGATSVAFQPAVLSLKVKPQITPDDKVIMDLEVKKDAVGQVFQGIPSIDTKKITTQILVENGETAVLGGIYEQIVRTDDTKVPLLGDIPYLGALFRNTQRQDDKTELLIFITPKIIKEGVAIR